MTLAATRRNRTAAVVAVAAAGLDALRSAWPFDGTGYFNARPLVFAAITVLVLAAVAVCPGSATLGRLPLALFASSALLGIGSALSGLVGVLPAFLPDRLNQAIPYNWIFLNGVTSIEALVLGLSVILGAIAVFSTPAPLRRRIIALLSPVGAILLLTRLGLADGTILNGPNFGDTAGVNLAQCLALTLIPLPTLAIAAALVHRREHTLRLLTLGRAADQQTGTSERVG
jgi:hypothetical protein